MLPSFLQSSYKQYKSDSNFVAAWLARSAQRCGYPKDLLVSQNAPPQKPPKLKGRARKLARDAAAQSSKAGNNGSPAPETAPKPPRYLIAVKDFINLAEWIAKATKPIIEVPPSFVYVLDRAITVRKKHHQWWASEGDNQYVNASQKNEAHEKHQFFIDVLEKVREILRPRMPTEVLSDVPASVANETLPNLFSGLKVEQPCEIDSAASDIQVDQTLSSSPSQHEYEVKQEDDIEEVYFAVHCLFNDLDNIRRYLNAVWEGYKDGMFDIIAASITTNTAIEFSRRLQEDFLETFPKHTDFEMHINVLYVQQCLAFDQDPMFKEKPDDEMNFNIYNQVEPLMFPTFMLLSSFTDVLQPGNLPVCKPGHFGAYDPSTDRNSHSARAKFREDKVVLLEILPQFCIVAQHRGPIPAEDEFTRGVREMIKTRAVPIWLVFATQVFLDIHHILRERVTAGFADLCKSAAYVETNIKLVLEFHENLRIDTWPRSNDQALLQILGLIDEWVKTDKISKIRTRLAAFLPPDVSHLLMKQHPLYCGLLCYSIKALAVDAAITFANAWGSVLYCAHLYNAVRQEKLLTDVWEDMNLALFLHDTDRMFVGNFPKTCEDYFKRFCMAMGYSAANFAKNKRSIRPPASKAGPRGLNDLAPVSNKFKARFCHGDERAGLLPDDIEAILKDYNAKTDEIETEDESGEWYSPKIEINIPESPSSTQESKLSKAAKLHSKIPSSVASGVRPLIVLNALLEAIQSEGLQLTFDHFRLHTFCWRLLRSVQEDLDSELRDIYGTGYLEQENQLPWIVGYILMTASQTSKLAGVLAPKKKDVVTSRLLAKAAESIKTMIDSGAGRIGIEVIKRHAGHDIDMDDILSNEPKA